MNLIRFLLWLFVRLKKSDLLALLAIRLLFISLVILSLIITLNLNIWSNKYRPEAEFLLNSFQNSQEYNEEFFNKTLSIGKFYHVEWSTYTNDAQPWFMKNGSIKPSAKYSSHLALWPEEMHESDYSLPQSDRIINQLMFVPKVAPSKHKTILLFFGKSGLSWLKLGQEQFLEDNCPVNACTITDDVNLIDSVDAVFFKDRFSWPINGRRNMNQVWILYLLENPFHTMRFKADDKNIFNWTATYRHDSDIVAPYGKFVHYSSLNDYFKMPLSMLEKNEQINNNKNNNNNNNNNNRFYKTSNEHSQIAWFVSNCGARNERLAYARELSKHIPVDIYGSCGQKKCPRYNTSCMGMLMNKYRYYLSFENANCRDYITEKFYSNALDHGLVPIVMGATKDDYQRMAPYNSFIHVNDFKSPKHLALFLHQLNRDPIAFERYNQWRYSKRFSGQMINTFFWCRLCAMLHAPSKPTRSYQDIENWWNGPEVCHKTPTHKWRIPSI